MTEGSMEATWWIIIFAFVVGLVLGGFVSYLISKASGKSAKLQAKVNTLEHDLNNYREKVNEHFLTTAELINRLTESYRDVHQHLASSADELCTNKTVQAQLQDAMLSASSMIAENKKDEEFSKIPPKDYVAYDEHVLTAKGADKLKGSSSSASSLQL